MPRLPTTLAATLACGFLLAPAHAQTPADACGSAPAIGGGTHRFSTTAATSDGPSSACAPSGNDVWLRFTPACAGPVSVTTCGSNFDTVLDVFTACPSGGGIVVSCNDDTTACGAVLTNPSSLAFDAAAGTTYWIRIGGFNGAVGSAVLNVQGPCDDAVSYQGRLVSGGVPVSGVVNLQFQLFDAPSGGFSIGPLVEKYGITAADGIISTLLDFGPDMFTAPRWLQIAVNDPAAGPDFVVLDPRHLIASAPRALRADNGGLGGVVIESHAETSGAFSNTPASSFQDIFGTERYGVVLPAGTAVMNWSVTFYTTAANIGFELRPAFIGVTAAAQFGIPTRHFLNQASVHTSASGTAAFNIEADAYKISIQERRYTGTGNFVHDGGDSSSWTVTVHRR
ncbi:MAG: hypothetical protein ACKVS8_11675 [Phycisphaerales bacterium]